MPAQATAFSRKRIDITGIVQGVGFRPFVYNLAKTLGLRGYVLNSSAGVTMEIEGGEAALDQFLETLRREPPPLARMEQILVTEMEALGDAAFVIRESAAHAGEFVLVSPDVATCDECWREFTDPDDRRFGYPFTNCTNCGPRYTIIQDIPYDRPMTTMSEFDMCDACRAEYHDPGNRRFHAQPNACPECGPTLALAKSDSFMPLEESSFGCGDLSISTVREVRGLLREGKIIAIRGLGGFHLACDAQNDETVQGLRKRKRRSDKPFAVMARDLESVERFALLTDADRALLTGRKRPIVILPRRSGAPISAAVAPNNNSIGVMLPYTPLHYLLFGESPGQPPEFTALVMTSGNMSEEPIVTNNDEAWRRLRSVADWFLFHNREIHMRVDDSVVRTFENKERVLRRSRAYVPNAVDLGSPMTELLACGAELKNTFCLTKGQYAILSQHIGDLENYETLQFFQETLANLKKLFRVEPRAVAYDLHPLYMSTKFALESGLDKVGVQHHHAHIASCMAENRLREKVIGVALDGTGYGTDGQIWGGEFLVAGLAGFERRAHFRYVGLPGGDAAVREPWRLALSYLVDTFGANRLPSDLTLWSAASKTNVALVRTMLERGINTVKTSSCGRLFDAVSSLTGVRHEVNFEGQAAIDLEMLAHEQVTDAYAFEVTSSEPWEIDFRPAIERIVRQVREGAHAGDIAARFHNTVAAVIVEVCRRLRESERLSRVCLSGGTFQNMYLLKRAVSGLRACGFEVYFHSKVPPNDGGISLGQAAVANEILQSGAPLVPGDSRQP